MSHKKKQRTTLSLGNITTKQIALECEVSNAMAVKSAEKI